ncbi:MAG: hypothetical protein ACRDKE_03540 [Solirubrobacterales bacterium]
MNGLEEERAFDERMAAAVEAATAALVADGRATLTREYEEGPGEFMTLRPTNPRACEVEILLDGYPTVVFGGATDEMFGDDDERIEHLLEDLADVIAGRFVWGCRQEKVLWGLMGTVTIQYGEFLELDGGVRRSFTRGGGEPEGLVEHHTFEPY